MGVFKLVFLLIFYGYLCQPAFASDGFRTVCRIAQMANKDGSSGKQELSAALQRAYGWSKYKADTVTNMIVRKHCPGVW